MAINSVLQIVIDYARVLIPDRKLRNDFIKEEIGMTDAADKAFETFYTNHVALATPVAYIKQYKYTGVPTLALQSATAKVFLWTAADQSLKFGNSTTGYDPPNGEIVFAEYNYAENMDYHFSDENISDFVPNAVEGLNAKAGVGFTFSGTSPDFTINTTTSKDKFLLALAVAVEARGLMLEELEKTGLGVSFRGGLYSVDSSVQLREMRDRYKMLVGQLDSVITYRKLGDAGPFDIGLFVENEYND